MGALSLRLPDEVEARLDAEARREGVARSEVARAAIVEFLDRRERDRFLAEIARAARARGNEEALAMAEEALPFDNEALAIAEGRTVQEPKAKYRARRAKRR
jgi:predicted transcriptional regulator